MFLGKTQVGRNNPWRRRDQLCGALTAETRPSSPAPVVSGFQQHLPDGRHRGSAGGGGSFGGVGRRRRRQAGGPPSSADFSSTYRTEGPGGVPEANLLSESQDCLSRQRDRKSTRLNSS